MTRRIPGLSQAGLPTTEVPTGLYLVSVGRVQYRWEKHKPYYAVRFAVREPKPFVGTSLPARLYSTPKALWKLAWFLREHQFGIESTYVIDFYTAGWCLIRLFRMVTAPNVTQIFCCFRLC